MTEPSEDRRVHAETPQMQVVRYDKAGAWYLEPTDPVLPRQKVKVRDAARYAAWAAETGGQIFFGLPGGGTFDRYTRDEQ